MATANDQTRLSVAPFTTPQRQRLEALTAAKMLLNERRFVEGRGWQDATPPISNLLDLADYIVTGTRP